MSDTIFLIIFNLRLFIGAPKDGPTGQIHMADINRVCDGPDCPIFRFNPAGDKATLADQILEGISEGNIHLNNQFIGHNFKVNCTNKMLHDLYIGK